MVNMVPGDAKLVEFQLGCLDDIEQIKPEFHMHTSEQASWFEWLMNFPGTILVRLSSIEFGWIQRGGPPPGTEWPSIG